MVLIPGHGAYLAMFVPVLALLLKVAAALLLGWSLLMGALVAVRLTDFLLHDLSGVSVTSAWVISGAYEHAL